jgi:hypothetical protein
MTRRNRETLIFWGAVVTVLMIAAHAHAADLNCYETPELCNKSYVDPLASAPDDGWICIDRTGPSSGFLEFNHGDVAPGGLLRDSATMPPGCGTRWFRS